MLTNGVPVTGLVESTIGGDLMYSIVVPSGKRQLVIKTSGSIGDDDIYVGNGYQPTDYSYDTYSDNYGDYENITYNNPAAGTYYILVEAYEPFSGVSLVATFK